jgi:hypothetical protein
MMVALAVAGASIAAVAAVPAVAIELIQLVVLFAMQFKLARLVDMQCVQNRRQSAYSDALIAPAPVLALASVDPPCVVGA